MKTWSRSGTWSWWKHEILEPAGEAIFLEIVKDVKVMSFNIWVLSPGRLSHLPFTTHSLKEFYTDLFQMGGLALLATISKHRSSSCHQCDFFFSPHFCTCVSREYEISFVCLALQNRIKIIIGHLPHHTGVQKADSARDEVETLRLTCTVPCTRRIAQTCLTHTATTSMGSKYVCSLKSHVPKLFTFYAFQTSRQWAVGYVWTIQAKRRTTRIVPVMRGSVSCSPTTPNAIEVSEWRSAGGEFAWQSIFPKGSVLGCILGMWHLVVI